MSLHKQCKSCRSLFPAEIKSLEILCDKQECQERKEAYANRIKKSRGVPMDYFDVYDLDRPYKWSYIGYERVCRYCGNPLLKKNGSYSAHLRYCQEHREKGYELFDLFNWSSVSKTYAFHVQDQFKEEIEKKVKKLGLQAKQNHFVICEECHKLCLIFDYYNHYYENFKVINIHHKKPVHTLKWDDLYLIWDFDNLICLCQECHNEQDHQLKKIEMVEQENRSINEWL